MENLFIMDKGLMRQVIESIKSLNVDCKNFDEADKWVGIILLLEQAMNPPIPVEETDKQEE